MNVNNKLFILLFLVINKFEICSRKKINDSRNLNKKSEVKLVKDSIQLQASQINMIECCQIVYFIAQRME